jgi:hypothetical protein
MMWRSATALWAKSQNYSNGYRARTAVKSFEKNQGFKFTAANVSDRRRVQQERDPSPNQVTVPPITQGIGLGADGQTLSVSGVGLASRPYYLNMASNLTPPVMWLPIQTNIANDSGDISFTNITPTNAQQFFRISAP